MTEYRDTQRHAPYSPEEQAAFQRLQDAEDFLEGCESCGADHPRGFSGDCRDDANRYVDSADFLERNPTWEKQAP